MADEATTGATGTESGGTSGSSSGGSTTAAGALARAASQQESSAASGTTGTTQPPSGQGGTTAAATGQTGQPVTPGVQPGRGPIPYDRHEAALRNAREQTRQEVAQQFAWASGMDQKVVERAVRLAKQLDMDPRAFASQLAKELGPQESDSYPEADLVSNTGVKAFSDTAVTKALSVLENRLRREFEGKLAPVLSDREKAQQQAETDRMAGEGRAVIRDALTHLSSLPHFKENEKAISEVMATIPRATVDRMGVVTAMYMAYSMWQANELPKLLASNEQKVHDDMRRQAASATGNVLPNGGQASQGARAPRNVSELSSHMAKLAETLTQ